jgi:hypothetical protein
VEILLITTRPELDLRIKRALLAILIDNTLQVESPDTNITFFLTNYLIDKKNHLDLIIVDDYHSELSHSLDGHEYSIPKPTNTFTTIEFIGNNSTETYSKSNYYLRNIPIIKICNEHDDVNPTERNYIYFDYCLDIHIDNYLLEASSKAIAYTRDLIISDLKTLGLMLDNKYHLIKTNFALYHYEKDLKILSKEFVERQKLKSFYWFEYPIEEVEEAINRYMDMISTLQKFDKREEKEIHRFFKKNPYFILRDKYSDYYYEVKFQNSADLSAIAPDFILKPFEFKEINETEIFEIKLPGEGIVKKKRFHQNFRSDFWEHLVQVKDYQDYFRMHDVQDEIIKKLGYLPSDYLYTLLVGNSEHKDLNLNVIDRLARQFNFQDINILTFDELLNYQIRYFEREKMIKKLTKYSC